MVASSIGNAISSIDRLTRNSNRPPWLSGKAAMADGATPRRELRHVETCCGQTDSTIGRVGERRNGSCNQLCLSSPVQIR